MKQRSVPAGETFTESIGVIYESALDPAMTHLLMQQLRAELGAGCIHLQERDLPGGHVVSSEFRDERGDFGRFHRDYVDRWQGRDPTANMLLARPGEEVLHQEVSAISDRSFREELLLRHGVGATLGGCFDSGPRRRTLVLARRAAHAGPFPAAAVASLRRFLPHLRRAAAVRSLVERAQAADAGADLLHHLPVPCLLTDVLGRSVENNERFRLATSRLGLRVVLGRVRFRHDDQQAAWQQALLETDVTGVGQLVRIEASDGPGYCITLKPWRQVASVAGALPARLMLAVFEEQASSRVDPEAVVRDAGLTPAEWEVLGAMLAGLPAKAIATRRGASVNTVRTQIVAVLEKTGHRSQRALIAAFSQEGFSTSAFTSPLGHENA
jgi:DNA-binding CsgD family transcriptional regulator